ncbi:MAG: methylenetetrahydrofolate reductase [Deltaproteobacteria bacterium]|nr:methylenetetrahydrofolate reductase [Candidatus Anaeroferrophillus wilburensis]MBN2889722.1 methylenetetrahydrofolate reductase [Deltaproteobacteria bacterium]
MSLKSKFDAGEFVTLAEMEPPKGVDVLAMITNANQVKYKVDAFVVPEMSNAVMRMSSLGGALILQNKGLETIMQVNCRDRNQLALQADLLAAGAAGVSGVIAVPGDDPVIGDHHQAKSVYDLDMNQLLQAANGLRNGTDLAGNSLAGAPGFLLGASVNAGAKDKALAQEIKKAKESIDAGARFLITNPLFELNSIDSFIDQFGGSKATIIPTVLVLKSVGMARYINQTQEHISIPDALIERIRKASDKPAECIRIAREMISAIHDAGFGGVLISTVGWEHRLPEILP